MSKFELPPRPRGMSFNEAASWASYAELHDLIRVGEQLFYELVVENPDPNEPSDAWIRSCRTKLRKFRTRFNDIAEHRGWPKMRVCRFEVFNDTFPIKPNGELK